MKPLSTIEESSGLTTDDWFQLEKELFALSSPHRPDREKKLDFSFRQTKFPIEKNIDCD